MNHTVVTAINNYANLLMLIAAALYVVHIASRSRLAGMTASVCAFLGSCGLAVCLTELWLNPHDLSTVYTLSFALSLINAMTVTLYLIMEKWYGNRSAGAFVMSIVAIAVIFQSLGGTTSSITPDKIWLMAQQTGNRLYELVTIGFTCAFIWAACCAVIYLWRLHSTRWAITGQASDPILQSMYRSVEFGLPLYTLALILGIPFSGMTYIDDWGRYLHYFNLLLIWLFYMLYRLLQARYHGCGQFMAWCSISGLVLCFLFLPKLPGSHQLLN